MTQEKNHMNAHFSLRLSSEMKRNGLTQESLASKLGITHSAISRWLSGSKPRPSMFKQLADALGVSVRFLEFGDAGAGEDVSLLKEDAMPYQVDLIAALRDQLAEKDRQIERLLGLLESRDSAPATSSEARGHGAARKGA